MPASDIAALAEGTMWVITLLLVGLVVDPALVEIARVAAASHAKASGTCYKGKRVGALAGGACA